MLIHYSQILREVARCMCDLEPLSVKIREVTNYSSADHGPQTTKSGQSPVDRRLIGGKYSLGLARVDYYYRYDTIITNICACQ